MIFFSVFTIHSVGSQTPIDVSTKKSKTQSAIKAYPSASTSKAGKPVIVIDPSNGGLPFFSHYGTEQGLALNNVICSAIDKKGNIWLGTGGGGVSRFDGKNFTNYTSGQGLASNVIFCIREDARGNIWFGTTAGASKFDGKKFVNYTTEDGLAGDFISCILLDKTGKIWFGTHEGGVSRYDGKHFTTFNKANGLTANYVRCLLQDRHGDIWIGMDGAGLCRFDGERFYNFNTVTALNGRSVNCIIEDDDGTMWIGTDVGITEFDGKSFINYSHRKGLPKDAVYAIAQTQGGKHWIGTGASGMSVFDGKNFTNYSIKEGVPSGKINSLLLDHEGNLWFTSQGGGLNKYWGNGLTYFTSAQGLAGNLVFFITQDKFNRLWFATYEGGASMFDGRKFSNYTAAQGLGDNIIWGVFFDREGNTWFATDRAGVTKFDGHNFIHYTMAQGLPSNSVITMMQDSAGNMWFGTRGNGVSKFDGRHFINFSTQEGLPGNNVQRIVQDNAGDIWLATYDNGLSRFDGKNFLNYGTKQGLIGHHVITLILDRRGHLWAGTDQGASEFDGKKFTNYTTGQGLADNTITEIVEDKIHRRIWFGTSKGLSMLHSGRIENFNQSSGYPLEDVSTSGLFADSAGIVWLGSGGGKLIRFDPGTALRTKTTPPVLQIQTVRINNETICWNCLLQKNTATSAADSLTILMEQVTAFGKTLPPKILDNLNKRFADIALDSVGGFYPVPSGLVLPNKDNQISIDFAAISPGSSTLIKYQYQLEGSGKGWSPLAHFTTAVFGNLSAGVYTFRVKALSPLGGWSHARYTFRVLPPWWLTWWAMVLYVLAGSGSLYGLYRNRISILERRQAAQLSLMVATQEEERRRISRDLHDEVGIKLSAIKLFLSALYEKSYGAGQEDILNLAQNSENLISEVMQDVRQLLRDLSPLVLEEFGYLTAVESVVDKINETKSTRFQLTSFGLAERLLKDYELALYRMTQELINNVLKHAAASHAFLQAGRRDGKLILIIEDDGKGFDTSVQKEGYGLHHLETRVSLLGGSIHIDSSAGNGTNVIIEIPYNPE